MDRSVNVGSNRGEMKVGRTGGKSALNGRMVRWSERLAVSVAAGVIVVAGMLSSAGAVSAADATLKPSADSAAKLATLMGMSTTGPTLLAQAADPAEARTAEAKAIMDGAAPGEAAKAQEAEQVAESEADWAFGGGVTFNSKYVWRGQLLTDGPVFQPTATVAWKGLSFNIWGNLDLDDVNGLEGDFNEVDFTLDYSHEIYGPLSGSIGVIHYWFPNTAFPNTTEVYVGLSVDCLLNPSVTAYFDVDQADGSYVSADISHSFELPEVIKGVAASIDVSGGFGWGSSNYNSYYFGKDRGGYNDFHTTLSVPVVVAEHFTIAPTVSYTTIVDGGLRSGRTTNDNVFYGITLSVDF